MNVKLLRSFVALADKKNYANAAAQLSTTQPALTKQINALENQLNLSLFNRGRQGTTLTAAGRRLLPEAEKVIKQTDNFMLHARQVGKGAEGFIAVGFGLSSFYFAPQCIARFRHQFPGIDITLEDIPSDQQYEMLRIGELQIGFVRLSPGLLLQHHPLFEDRLVLITPYASPLTTAEWLTRMPLLRLYTWRGRGLNAQIDRFLAAQQLFAAATQEVEDIQTIIAMVIAGLGIALLPQSVVHIAPASLPIVPLDGDNTRWQVGIAWEPLIPDYARDNFIAMLLADNPLPPRLGASRL